MAKLLRIFSLGGNEVSPVNIKDPKTGKSVIPDIALQWQRTADTCRIIADIIERHPDDLFLITHGNGPQVGNILLRAEYSRPILHPLPLDICGADTQGAMGYMLSQLSSELRMRGIEKIVAETVTQVVVDANDPDFKEPTKFIGPQYTKDEALERQRKDGWRVKYYGKDKEGKKAFIEDDEEKQCTDNSDDIRDINIDKNRKIGSLTEEEIKKVSEFLKKPNVPIFIFNRRRDFETGEDRHLVGTDLELQKDFDIKRMRKIKSYKGLRHAVGLPVRGQRTRSHFRKNRKKGSGIKKKVVKREAPQQYTGKGKK